MNGKWKWIIPSVLTALVIMVGLTSSIIKLSFDYGSLNRWVQQNNNDIQIAKQEVINARSERQILDDKITQLLI
jgi:hypothetical protein